MSFDRERLRLVASLERSHFWFLARRTLIERLLAGTTLVGSTAVDIGCGTGSFAEALASRGVRVLALDYHADGLQQLRTACSPAWVARAEGDRLPVASRAIDIVFALDVLEHLEDERAMGEIARILKPGGAVLATVPACPWLWSGRDEAAGHRRRYTRDAVVRLMRNAGLEVVDVRFYQCLLLPAFIVARLLGRRWKGTLALEDRPSGWLNRVCLAVNRFEIQAGAYVPWPWGSSLAFLGRKPV